MSHMSTFQPPRTFPSTSAETPQTPPLADLRHRASSGGGCTSSSVPLVSDLVRTARTPCTACRPLSHAPRPMNKGFCLQSYQSPPLSNSMQQNNGPALLLRDDGEHEVHCGHPYNVHIGTYHLVFFSKFPHRNPEVSIKNPNPSRPHATPGNRHPSLKDPSRRVTAYFGCSPRQVSLLNPMRIMNDQ